ncbi:MAG TPA: dienelactone hydrolase family protein [Caulobacteraceae bacterium]|jgi:acetyl esterase/lipase|nr:dienelactone hydrolase family protein [Caulobacteraceae bacterium]
MADDAKAGWSAPAGDVIALWDAPPPRTIAGVGPEAVWLPPAGLAAGTPFLRNVSEPTLTVFQPAPGKANGVGVVVCPGGGWTVLTWRHEGTEVVRWLTERGYTAFLLKYRVSATPDDEAEFLAGAAAVDALHARKPAAAECPRAMDELMRGNEALLHAREIADDDGRRAMALVRERAGEWGVDPARVGLIGFSAGAFLVVDVAMDPQGAPPAFVAAIYGGETRGRPVPADAPPLFTLIAQDDRLLFHMVEQLYLDWSDADRSAELHIFARGAHGFGMIPQGLPSDRWLDLFEAWLADRGFA